MSRTLSLLITATMLSVLGGCASGTPVSEIDPVLTDIPADLQARFKVVETVRSPVVTQAPEKKIKPKKVSKTPVVKISPVFVYPDRRMKPDPIWIGEKQTLEVTYIGLAAGEFVTEVLPNKQIGGRTVYHLKASAVSSSMLNLFYRLNDTIESFWDLEGLFSHRFHLVLDETKQKRDALELFDSETKKVFYWNRRNHAEKGSTESRDTMDMVPFPQDSFSALFYVRTLPLESGKIYTFPLVTEGRGWECLVTVIRREMMDTPMGRKQTIVIQPQTRFEGVMKQEGEGSLIWLTDDDRRFIVRVEAKVKVGSIAARLKSIELGVKPGG